MGLLSFAKSAGGGGIISSAMGLIAGGVAAKKQRKWQEKQNRLNREFAENMAEQQNQYEVDRMGLQAQYNKEAADYSQQLAKDMWNYTGYENQKAQMEAAGLNTALMYGSGGGGGQSTSGGSQQGVTALQPMGLQVALQAEQARANIALTEAQTAKTRAETMKTNTTEMANSAIDVVGKMITNNATKVNTKKAEEEINNIKMTNQQISESINKLKNENKLLDFENWINGIKKNAAYIEENGARITFEDLFRSRELEGLRTECRKLRVDFQKAEFENYRIVDLFNNLEEIIKGEVDGYRINTKKYEEMDWNLKNDKAFGDLLESIGADSKFSKLILGIIKYFANK